MHRFQGLVMYVAVGDVNSCLVQPKDANMFLEILMLIYIKYKSSIEGTAQ